MGTTNNLPQDKTINSLWLLLPDAIKSCVTRITIPFISLFLCAYVSFSWAGGEEATEQHNKTGWDVKIDCDTKQQQRAQLICIPSASRVLKPNDAHLTYFSDLPEVLLYITKYALYFSEDPMAIKTNHNVWLKQIKQCVKDIDSLKNCYQSRIDELVTTLDPDSHSLYQPNEVLQGLWIKHDEGDPFGNYTTLLITHHHILWGIIWANDNETNHAYEHNQICKTTYSIEDEPIGSHFSEYIFAEIDNTKSQYILKDKILTIRDHSKFKTFKLKLAKGGLKNCRFYFDFIKPEDISQIRFTIYPGSRDITARVRIGTNIEGYTLFNKE